ncbi:MAG: hypothetical protein NUV61_03905 [Candidatus Azambacteria bacterium]|nr:hypothetical protein [Candidatus Azambacteria bacterium]
MKKILYIHPEENIAYLIDRLENTEGDTLYLAADEYPELFMDAVNMKLLAREATVLEKRIVIISQNPTVLEMARNVSFDIIAENATELERQDEVSSNPIVAPTEQHSEQEQEESIPVRVIRDENIRIPSSYDEVLMSPPRDHDEEVRYNHPEKERSADVTYNTTPSSPERVMRGKSLLTTKFVIISFTTAAILAGAAFFILSPRLSVTVIPMKESLRFDFQAIADSKTSVLDVDKSKVPGQIITIEKEVNGEYIASAKQDTATKAEGMVTLYNEFSSSAQPLVKNTRLRSPDGKIFRLKGAVTVPGATVQGGTVTAAGTVETTVIADEAGAAYNIGSSSFVIPGFEGSSKFASFSAKSSSAMTGGGSGEGYVATADDIARAKTALQSKLTEETKGYVEANIPKGFVVLEGSATQRTPEFSANQPDADGKFIAHIKVTYDVFAFSENDIAALAEYHLSKKLLDARKALPGTRVITYEREAFGPNRETLSFTVKASELVEGAIDGQQIKEMLAGKGEVDIQKILSANDAIESAEATFWPFWISLAPSNPKRITITVVGS